MKVEVTKQIYEGKVNVSRGRPTKLWLDGTDEVLEKRKRSDV